MSELACNIVLYRPDPDMLAARYRYWHVEALLSQADALINRCLQDYGEYCHLDFTWHELQTDLEAQEKKLGVYNQTAAKDVFVREMEAPQDEGVSTEAAQGAMEEQEILTLEEAVEEESSRAATEDSGIKSSLELRAEAFFRKKELAAPGKPFALDERRDLALKRLCRDYEEAVNRAMVAEQGLKILFDQVGQSSPLPSGAETLGTSLTTLAIWIRNSSEWLAGYRLQEQPFTRVISLRSLMNRNAWAVLKHSRESYSTKLQIPADLFRGHDNCRLRGVGAALVGEAGTVPWTFILRLPEEAVYERSGQSVEVDQSGRATCLLGRVESRRSVRPLEVCAATSWLNASPIGRSTAGGMWSLDILRPAGSSSESFGHLEDVILEIRAVGIPQKMTS